MLTFIAKRLVSAVGLVLLVTFVTFALVFSNGMAIARTLLGNSVSEAEVVAKYRDLGLDQPVVQQYGQWLGAALTGNLGRSYVSGEVVAEAIMTRLPVTLTLVLLTLLFALVISVGLGVAAAVKGGWVDRVLQVVSVVGGAIPQFIVAVFLVVTFAVTWRLLPATGYVSPDVDPVMWALSLVLPVTAILVGAAASGSIQIRGRMLDELRKEYVATLRTRGISERSVLFKHALRNAAGPGLIGMGILAIGKLGGSVLIERVFALPGLGMLANTSTVSGDIPMLMACVLFTILVVVVINLVIDLLLGVLNPKVRL